MKTLTVFTPTYNRAHTLPRTYESLLRQTCKDFEWLVIDDGSTDGTAGLVRGWIEENRIPIRYIYKENGGLYTGYNKAYEVIETELNVCIDSDDFMPDNAVELITGYWKEHGSDEYAGITGLDFTLDGKPIGGYFPGDLKVCHMMDLYIKKNPFRRHQAGDAHRPYERGVADGGVPRRKKTSILSICSLWPTTGSRH